MPKTSDISAICITLKVGDKSALFILLTEDGTINRSGNGTENNKDNDLFIGITDKSLFINLRDTLTDKMLENMGGYDVPDKKGKECSLDIALSFKDEEDNGFGFRYGTKSIGPPTDICEFISKAVELTEPWFVEQKKMVRKSKKPWWKFW